MVNSTTLYNSNSNSESGINTFLAPPSINTSLRSIEKAVDPHVHIYNASDWQVGGGLAGPFAHSQKQPLRRILQELAPIVESITQAFAMKADDELPLLNQWAALTPSEARDKACGDNQQFNQSVAATLYEALLNTEFVALINVILKDQSTFFSPEPHDSFSESFLTNTFQNIGNKPPQPPWYRFSNIVQFGLYSKIKGLIGFLYYMMSPRHKNLCAYQKSFTISASAIGVTRCYSTLLDFDRWVGKDIHPPSPLSDQVKLMARISELSGGYMQPLAAYNPWTDIEESDASLNLVIDAVEKYKFAGVKIYNQIGFYPSDNASQPYPSDSLPRPASLSDIDKKLSTFFEFCREADVAVMCHSGDSMGRTRDYNGMGGPEAWRKFFSHKDSSGTRVNLGHFGGDEKGPSKPRNWTKAFVSVMKENGTEYLYGDMGMWKKFVDGKRKALRRLRNILDTPVSNGQKAQDRIMFGSDWVMLSADSAWKEYGAEFYKILEEKVSDDILKKIMYENAEDLYECSNSLPMEYKIRGL